MSRIVVDASVAVKWYVSEPRSDFAQKLLTSGHELLAPDLLVTEFGNVLWKRVRAGEIVEQEAERSLHSLLRIPIWFCPSTALIVSALEIANRTQRSVYDSLYLALAVAEATVLVTADSKLYNALRPTPLAGSAVWIEAFAA